MDLTFNQGEELKKLRISDEMIKIYSSNNVVCLSLIKVLFTVQLMKPQICDFVIGERVEREKVG